MNLPGAGRAPLHAYTERKELRIRRLCPPLCAAFTATVLTWESAFPCRRRLSTLAYEQKQPRRFCRPMCPCPLPWMAFSIHSGPVPGVAAETFAILSLGVAAQRCDRAPKTGSEQT